MGNPKFNVLAKQRLKIRVCFNPIYTQIPKPKLNKKFESTSENCNTIDNYSPHLFEFENWQIESDQARKFIQFTEAAKENRRIAVPSSAIKNEGSE